MIEDETWKVIDEFPDYEVSNAGNIRSLKGLKHEFTLNGCSSVIVLKSAISKVGYKHVTLSYRGNTKTKDIHRIVAQHFVPNPDNKKEVNHINGNKLDNRACNLNWKTPSENHQHALAVGLRKDRGSGSVNAKLSENQVLEIRRLYQSGNFTYKQIGEMYNTHTNYIGLIIKRKRWAHLQDQ